jgi:hypothetical protein
MVGGWLHTQGGGGGSGVLVGFWFWNFLGYLGFKGKLDFPPSLLIVNLNRSSTMMKLSIKPPNYWFKQCSCK